MSDEKTVAAAVVAALNAAGAVAYELDKVPAPPPALYTEVTVHRRVGGERRVGAAPDMTLWRIATRSVAQLVNNAREVRRRQGVALEDQSLAIDGKTTTPIEFETADPIGPDGDEGSGWFSGLTTWTCAL